MSCSLGLLPGMAVAKESVELQNQLNTAESNLSSALYCVESQGKFAIEFDGYIATAQESVKTVVPEAKTTAENRLAELIEARRRIAQTITECSGYVQERTAQVTELRTRLAAALAEETAAAAEEARKKTLSENETKIAVETATTEVAATKQRIQTDTYNIQETTSKIEELNNSLATVDKNSATYSQVQASIAALETIRKAAEGRMQKNLEIQAQQKSLLEELKAINTNAVTINAAAASELINSSKVAQDAVSAQGSNLEKEVGTLEEQLKKIDDLLSRLSKDSPEYQQLLSAKDALIGTLTKVKDEQQKVVEQEKQNEEIADQAKTATLSSRIATALVGKILDENEKLPTPVFKAKKINGKFSEVRTKWAPNEGGEIEEFVVSPDELDGVKVTLKAGKQVIRVNSVNVNDDGTLSFRIPRSAKSGTYTLTLDIPDSNKDVNLKVRINN